MIEFIGQDIDGSAHQFNRKYFWDNLRSSGKYGWLKGVLFESNSFRYQRFNSPFPTTGYNEYSCNLSVYSVYNGAWFGRIDNWLPDFTGNARVAIRIMNPIKTSVQQMSMLGKRLKRLR